MRVVTGEPAVQGVTRPHATTLLSHIIELHPLHPANKGQQTGKGCRLTGEGGLWDVTYGGFFGGEGAIVLVGPGSPAVRAAVLHQQGDHLG